MKAELRVAAAVSVLALTTLYFWWISGSDPARSKENLSDLPDTSGHGSLMLTTSESCRECHPQIYDEWRDSHHEFAWLNPEPRRKELSDNFKNQDCIPCHAPRPMIEVGFGGRPLERQDRRDDGINCFTCHQYKNVMAAANELSPAAASAPCQPVRWEPVKSMKLCAPCHDQHKVHQDWLATEFAVSGPEYKDCNTCHMPVKNGPGTLGGPRSTHRSHLFPGAHDPSMVRSASTMESQVFRLADGTLMVGIKIKNTGAGHNFPADERHRAADLSAQVVPDGEAAFSPQRLVRFRNPYRAEFELTNPFKTTPVVHFPLSFDGRFEVKMTQRRVPPAFNPGRKIHYPESTQLIAGESRVIWFPWPLQGAGQVVLRFYFKTNPVMRDEDALLLEEQKLRVDPALPHSVSVFPEILEVLEDRMSSGSAGSNMGVDSTPGLKLLTDAKARVLLDEGADSDVRLDLMDSLSEPVDQSVIEALLIIMKDKSQQAYVLDPLADASDYVALESPFGGPDQRAEIRWTAVRTLDRLGIKGAWPDFLAALNDRHPVVRNHAALALWNLGSTAGLPVLLKGLEGRAFENETANRFLKQVTGRDFGFSTDIGFRRKEDAITRWREYLANPPRPSAATPRVGDDKLLDRRIKTLIRLLGEHQFLFMEHARRDLSALDDLASAHLVEEWSRYDGDANQQARAYMVQVAENLVQRGIVSARRILLQAIEDPSAAVRARGLLALGRPGAEEKPDVFLRSMQDPDPGVRTAAVKSLGRLGHLQAARDFELLVKDEATPFALRLAAAVALARNTQISEPVATFLLSLLENKESWIREDAAVALAEWIPDLLGFDPAADTETRMTAVENWKRRFGR